MKIKLSDLSGSAPSSEKIALEKTRLDSEIAVAIENLQAFRRRLLGWAALVAISVFAWVTMTGSLDSIAKEMSAFLSSYGSEDTIVFDVIHAAIAVGFIASVMIYTVIVYLQISRRINIKNLCDLRASLEDAPKWACLEVTDWMTDPVVEIYRKSIIDQNRQLTCADVDAMRNWIETKNALLRAITPANSSRQSH